MDTMIMQQRVHLRTGERRIGHHTEGQAGWVAFAVAVLMFLALLPVYAGTAGTAMTSGPQPYPAPAPSYGGDPAYPEQAQP